MYVRVSLCGMLRLIRVVTLRGVQNVAFLWDGSYVGRQQVPRDECFLIPIVILKRTKQSFNFIYLKLQCYFPLSPHNVSFQLFKYLTENIIACTGEIAHYIKFLLFH